MQVWLHGFQFEQIWMIVILQIVINQCLWKAIHECVERMLAHPNIHLMLKADYREISKAMSFREVIYTGPIDEYFNYRFGKLPYRSLNFEFHNLPQETYQPTGTVNYPNEHAYTRITEFKYLTGQIHNKTTIVYEYPNATGDPYYPIPTPGKYGDL